LLVELGIVTIESSRNAYGKGHSIGRALNKVTGKESTSSYAFKEANWGEDTRQYLEDIKDLEDESIQEIVEKAMAIAKRLRKSSNQVATTDNQPEGSEPRRRRRLVDVPDN
jgi:hypothetical protein